MTAAAVAFTGRVERDFVIGDRRVDVGTAIPAPGESLSTAARRLAECLVAARIGLPAFAVRIATLLPSGRPIVSAESVEVSLQG